MTKVSEQQSHADDRRTLNQILAIACDGGDVRGSLEDAYHLGRIRGRLEGAEAVAERLSPF